MSYPPQQPWALNCAYCLFLDEEDDLPADTVINGHAVCGDHLDHAIDPRPFRTVIGEILAALQADEQGVRDGLLDAPGVVGQPRDGCP